MLNLFWSIGLLCLGAVCVAAQAVSTLLPPGSSINDGVAVDSRGNVFVAAHEGRSVHKIALDGTHTVLEHRFAGPNGLAFDAEDNLYIANAIGGYISKVAPNGETSRFVDDINNPGGLAFGPDGKLYATLKDDNQIIAIDRDGAIEKVVTGQGIVRPVGIVVDDDGVIYVASLIDGLIHRIAPDGQIDLMASVPHTGVLAIGFIALANGELYATAINDHFIYKVSLDGVVEVFAGTGVNGTGNGSALQAQFNAPHGIAYNPVDNALYVSDFNTKSLRKIDLPASTAVGSASWAQIKSNERSVQP